jgi:hypothetical protein
MDPPNNMTCSVKDLLVGWASRNITPDRPVALSGQFYVRISKGVLDPITATALSIEGVDKHGDKEQAIMVSCDLVGIRRGIQDLVREKAHPKLTGFDTKKLFLNATHTHTAPVMVEGEYPPQDASVMTPTEYADFLTDRIAETAVEAWMNRQPGGISRAFSHAVVGHNRRTHYFDGTSQMYGKTNRDDFDCIEGYEDHSLDILFTWDNKKDLTGIIINIACPSQVTEGLDQISADYWHEVRVELRKKYGEQLFVLPQCSAAGDQSPHFLLYAREEEVMRRRKSVSEREEIAHRIANAVDSEYHLADKEIQTQVTFQHVVRDLDVPARIVTEAEAARARKYYEAWKNKEIDKNTSEYSLFKRSEFVMKRYEAQKEELSWSIEIHILRLGDIVIATNPFELFLDYGLRIKARSQALQTFIVQLASGYYGYLPTKRAVAAGGYGAEAASNNVGPEGGQELVEQTVKLINEMWNDGTEPISKLPDYVTQHTVKS